MDMAATEMRHRLSLALCTLLVFSCCFAGDPCPSKEKLSPCTCTQKPVVTDAATTPLPRKKRDVEEDITPQFSNDTSYYTVVKCESVKSISELEAKISVALNRKWIDKLVVSNIPPGPGNTLTRLPRDWLTYARIRQLEIRNMQLSGDFISYTDSLKDQFESLYWLKASNCNLSGALAETPGAVRTFGLNKLLRLKGIDFSSNHLFSVMHTAFKTPPRNLTTVVLANNNIEYIEAGSFHNIILLKHIDLSHNRLVNYLRSYFAAPTKYLQHIDISWNNLAVLPADAFVNMPSLKSVDVSNNLLYSLPLNPWSTIWKLLSYINLSGNFIECDCQLLWILPILLSGSANQTEPKPLPGQFVLGQCVQTLNMESLETATHDLTSLKRDRVTC